MGLWERRATLVVTALIAIGAPRAQVIEFESGGLHYRTLTRDGFTVMFAGLPSHMRDYSIIQVAVSNGSPISWTVKPEDFSFHRPDGIVITATPAAEVVNSLMARASRKDVINLVTAYESGIYGNPHLKSMTGGYESRRRNALAEVGSPKLKAAAAASAIALVATRLYPGDSTDGAVFFASNGKPLGPGKLIVHAAAQDFEFDAEGMPAK